MAVRGTTRRGHEFGSRVAAAVAALASPLAACTAAPVAYVPRVRASHHVAPCPDPLVEGPPQGQLAGFVCGLLTVPESRADPTGPTIELSVAVAKATLPNPQPDPVVYLVGGPGGTGMQAGPVLVVEGRRSRLDRTQTSASRPAPPRRWSAPSSTGSPLRRSIWP
jgi:hypothetical protein